jgi:hypothetical protein
MLLVCGAGASATGAGSASSHGSSSSRQEIFVLGRFHLRDYPALSQFGFISPLRHDFMQRGFIRFVHNTAIQQGVGDEAF